MKVFAACGGEADECEADKDCCPHFECDGGICESPDSGERRRR